MIPENAVCSSVEIEMAGVCRGKIEPSGCEDAQKVAICEDDYVAPEQTYRQRNIGATGRLSGQALGDLPMPDKMDLRKDATTHVRPGLLRPASFASHFQLRISGMS